MLAKHYRLSRKVGFRYLSSKKKSSFLSFITFISIGGVAVGVFVMVVILSVMSGFENELKNRLFSAETHVLIESEKGFFKSEGLPLAEIKKEIPSIQTITPTVQTEVVLRIGKKISGAILKGVDSDYLKAFEKQIVEWEPNPRGSQRSVFVGQELALNLGILPGDRLTLVSPIAYEGPLGAIPRSRYFYVRGIFKTGVQTQESQFLFTDNVNVQDFLDRLGTINRVEVRVNHMEDAVLVSQALQQRIGQGYLVRSWQDLNSHLFHSLRLEHITMFCALMFIVIVASFNMISTLTMMVIVKKKSLSILRAMGATASQISSIFLWEGFAIGVLGVAIGVSLGLLVCNLLMKYPVIDLPDYFYDRTLPVVVSPTSITMICLCSLGIVLLAALLPARRASQLAPIEGIRSR